MMWDIALMVWRIGETVDFDAQVDWVYDAGFEAVSFHASAGQVGHWQGVDPGAADAARRRALRNSLARFSSCEIHAPFDLRVEPGITSTAMSRLRTILTFAADVGASIVTLHGAPPPTDQAKESAAWQNCLSQLDPLAEQAGVRVGLELTERFESLTCPGRPHVGVTLDVGHMYADAGRLLRPYGSLGNLIRRLRGLLLHVHVHDHNGRTDHVELGTGHVDFDDLLTALADVNYRGALCLELNPARASPEAMLRSAAFLRGKWS